MEEVLLSLALYFKKGIGPKKYLKLIEDYGAFWEGIKEEKIELDEELKKAEKELEKALKEDVKIIPLSSSKYPKLLREIQQPPIVLYVKGNLPEDNSISIVGSRKTTSYGKRVAFSLGKFLAENGICVVSGLAYGIDAFSHEGCLKSKGKTVAVLGTGVDFIYPRGNRGLAERILKENGALISEFPLGTGPAKENFPRRNRIISGLSYATVVVEAGESSGSLITAHFALEQGRVVFAVPGKIDSPYSVGTNRLIKEGAIPLLSFDDIFEELPFLKKEVLKKEQEISEEFKKVYSILKEKPMSVDELSEVLGESAVEIMTKLLEMEVMELVKREGNTYSVI